MEHLKEPYCFAISTALLAAAGTYAYMTVTKESAEAAKKATCKVLVIALAANLALTWVVHKREAISMEPFRPAA